MTKSTMLFPNRSDFNRAVQAQKMAKYWNLGIKKVEELDSRCYEIKSWSTPLFSHMQIVSFYMTRLKCQ